MKILLLLYQLDARKVDKSLVVGGFEGFQKIKGGRNFGLGIILQFHAISCGFYTWGITHQYKENH